MRHALVELLRKRIKEIFGLDEANIVVNPPEEFSFGDLSSPVAFHLAKKLKRRPAELADELAKDLAKLNCSFIASVEPVNGYINVRYSREYLQKVAIDIIDDVIRFSSSDVGKGELVQLEYVSANPTGPLNVVSARAAAVGSALVNLMRRAGFDAKSEYYVNDVGGQIEKLAQSFEIRCRNILGENINMPDDGYFGEYLIDYALEFLKDKNNRNKINLDYLKNYIVERILNDQLKALENFRTRFNRFVFESDIRRSGKIEYVVKRLGELGATYEKDGAVWFAASRYCEGAEDSVLVKRNGEYTYFLVDIAYHLDKFERGFSRVLDIWGPDHHGHLFRMEAAMNALGYHNRFSVILLQQVNLISEGEKLIMSKRAGRIITMEELVNAVGVDVARFFFLMRRIETPLDFDLDLAKKQSDENPVYYVQYAHARICSILNFAQNNGFVLSKEKFLENIKELKEFEEIELLRKLAIYPWVIERSAVNFEPQSLPQYLVELARLFHNFYHKHRVIGRAPRLPESVSYARLALIEAVACVIKDALELMGVSAPESM